MSESSVLRAGRKWSVRGDKVEELRRTYLVKLSSVLGADGEKASFAGVPAVGSKHPTLDLILDHYDVEEGKESDRATLVVTAVYKQETSETSGSEEEEQTLLCEDWGWDPSTEEREFLTAADDDATPVLNSAGDPFETVPTVTTFAPTFTKVMLAKELQAGWMDCNCKTNDTEITIAGISCPVGSLLCTVGLKRRFDDDIWPWRYTVQLRLKVGNLAKIEGAQIPTDIGWDVAIVEAGMRAKDPNDQNKKVICRVMDKETGQMCAVTSSALLDMQGYQVSDTDQSAPYAKRFQTHKRVTFPAMFYSLPGASES